MATKQFTLIFVLLFSLALWGQGVDTTPGASKGDGNQSGPTFTVTDCTSDGEVCGGIIKRVAPLNIPGVPVGATVVAGGGPNLSGNIDAAQGGQGAGSGTTSAMLGALVGMYVGWSKQGLRNGWDNFTHAEEGHLAGLQYFMGGPGDVEDGAAALGSGIRFGGPNGGGWNAGKVVNKLFQMRYFMDGDFHSNLSFWEGVASGTSWGANTNIPGRHLLGKLDVLVTNPKYSAAVERIGVKFFEKGWAIQNAIGSEADILEIFNEAAKEDIDYQVLTGENASQRKLVFQHYQKKGLKAFDN